MTRYALGYIETRTIGSPPALGQEHLVSFCSSPITRRREAVHSRCITPENGQRIHYFRRKKKVEGKGKGETK